jgi:hypothetical protein
MWEKAVQNRGFFPDRVPFSHLFPEFPGISHLFPHRFLRDEYEDKAHPPAPSHFRGRGRCLLDGVTRASLADSLCPGLHIGRPYRGCNVPRQAVLGTNLGRASAKCYALFRESARCLASQAPTRWVPRRDVRWRETWSRMSTKVRTEQARNSAMLRIVTGGTFFSTTDGHG